MARLLLALLAPSAAALDVRADRPERGGDRFADCIFEIVMVEKQPLGSSFNGKAVWSMNAVLNKAYADRWGYGFTLAQPQDQSLRWSKRPAASWYRVPYLQERLQAQMARKERCGWLAFLDSAAFIQDHSVSLPAYLDGLFKDQPLNLRTGGIFQWDQKKRGLVSDKVFLVQVNGHGEELLNAWRSSGDLDEAMRFEAAEQGTLTELLFPGKVATRSGKALKLFEVAHAKTVGGEPLRGKVTVLEDSSDQWGGFIRDTSHQAPGLQRKLSLEQLQRLGLAGTRFNERLSALSSGVAVRQWKVPEWRPEPERHRTQAFIAQRVRQVQASTTFRAPVLKLPEVNDENLEAEEKEIQLELGEAV